MWRINRDFIILAVLILFSGLSAMAGQAGRLDPTFGTNGKVFYDVGGGAVAAAVQADGKIVFAGETGGRFGVFRLNANGTPDTSFGINGQVRTSQIFPTNNRNSLAWDLVIQPNGKIIAVGQAERGQNPMPPVPGYNYTAVAVIRYNQDGSLDTTFGDGTGIVTTGTNGFASNNVGYAVELQADGKIVVVDSSDFSVIRYNENGSLDTAFGVNGFARVSFPGGQARALDLKIQTDGKIVAAGYDSPVFQQFQLVVVRYNTDGTLDPTFDGDGILVPAGLGSGGNIIIQPDGKLLVRGSFGFARFLSNGAFDTTFGNGGTAVIPPNFGAIFKMALQPDGKIVTVGRLSASNPESSDFAVARFLPNGSPDTNFDGDGVVSVNILLHEFASAVALQPDGKIVAAGYSRNDDTAYHLSAARLHAVSDTFADFDGDGKSDISIYRPSAREWWYLQSSDGQNRAYHGGSGMNNYRLSPADYNGDGKTDLSHFQIQPSTWFIIYTVGGGNTIFEFGAPNDLPAPADYDGDGKADATVFRPSEGNWYIRRSSDNVTTVHRFGISTDVPVAADYDGDGKADIAIYRPSTGEWWISRSSEGLIVLQFGISTDKPVKGDYTGDGKADVAVWRPSTGEWFVLRSEDYSYYAFSFGVSTDIPAPADYDGDGKFDAAVFRPSSGTWYINRSTEGLLITNFGSNNDKPVASAFVP